MTKEELLQEAMEAYNNPETRLSKNLRMHRERYVLRNRDRITNKQNKGSNDMRKGGMVLSTVDNRKVK